MTRLDHLRSILQAHDADAVLISRLTDIRWAVGFSGSNGLLVVDATSAYLITDGRYTEQAEREVSEAQVVITGKSLVEEIRDQKILQKARRVLFQSDDLTVARGERLSALISDTQWVGRGELFVEAVAQKSTAEVDVIRKAQAITEAAFEEVVGFIRPGVSEQEVAAEIVYAQLRRGAERMSFDPIVGSGPNGALPHARPSDRILKDGDLVVLDFGCVVDGYASDMTRTVAISEPPGEAVRAYEVVLTAQMAAIEAARAGMTGRELDAVARNEISRHGLGDYFTHGLGHGIGLQTHEWPRVSYSSESVLPRNCVVTIEPGVYLPGRFGIRIEDMIVIDDGPAVNLTSAPKNLIRV